MKSDLTRGTRTDWIPVQFEERSLFTEVYGFAGSQGVVNLEGVRFRPTTGSNSTLIVMMHPAAALQYMPFPRADRMHRRTRWVKDTLEELGRRGGPEIERSFVTHRTMADLRFLDPAVDPNDRQPGTTHIGPPPVANSGPAGLGRFSTLRSWLSQWSVDDSNVNGPHNAAAITVPLLSIRNSADEAAPASDTRAIHDAAGSTDKTMHVVNGATHYYQGQPALLAEAIDVTTRWLAAHDLIG